MKTLGRYLFAILGLLAILGGLGAVKYKQISSLISMGKAMQASGPPPEAVATTAVRKDTWQATLDAVGSVAAAKGVTVSNDAPGIVSAIHFESGGTVRQGQVLVELDSNVERAQLASVLARQELAQVNAKRTRALVAADAIPRSQQDTDDAVVRTSGSDLDQLRAQIDRKVVRAPFSGQARHPPDQPRAVPQSRHARSRSSPPPRPCSSTSRCRRSELTAHLAWHAGAGRDRGGGGCARGRGSRRGRPVHRRDDAVDQAARESPEPRARSCSPGCSRASR